MSSPSTSDTWSHVPQNLAQVQAAIATAATRAQRDPTEIEIVAISKTVPVEGLRAAIAAGQRLFGENRVQEALPKLEALSASDARFHLVGHLQTNKAKVATAFDMIESIDSVRVATALARHLSHPLPILLEVNVAGEASKFGFAPEDVGEAITAIGRLPYLEMRGLMTVAPAAAEVETVRPVFRTLRELAQRHALGVLSMGMTADFPVAVEEGATLVRIGRAIFGPRDRGGDV